MRDITQKDIEFLKELQIKTKTSENGEPLINNKEQLNKLIILVSSVNWQNLNTSGIFQKAADEVADFMNTNTIMRTLENTYVSTGHPYEITRMARSQNRIRVTLKMTVPDKDTKEPITRHICLVYETNTGNILPG